MVDYPDSDCCDSCPLAPTCEEERDFYRQIDLATEFEYGDE